MRLARKLFLLAAMALTALALGATTANAENPIEVEQEDGDHCTPVSLVPPHGVTGGCHISYDSEGHIPLTANFGSGPVVLSNCEVHIEAYVGEDGEGYVTEAKLTAGVEEEAPGCTRAPCDEAAPSHADLPWPLHIEEGETVEESPEAVEAEFCLRTIASGEGGAQTRCEVHLPVTQDLVNHNHQIGDINGDEYACEVQPIPGVIVQIHDVHFNVEDPSEQEDIEIIH